MSFAKVAAGGRRDTHGAYRHRATRVEEELSHESLFPTCIANEIDQGLRWNTHVDNYLINVRVNDGKVALSGTVELACGYSGGGRDPSHRLWG